MKRQLDVTINIPVLIAHVHNIEYSEQTGEKQPVKNRLSTPCLC